MYRLLSSKSVVTICIETCSILLPTCVKVYRFKYSSVINVRYYFASYKLYYFLRLFHAHEIINPVITTITMTYNKLIKV